MVLDRRVLLASLSLVSIPVLAVPPAGAQVFPMRPIRIVVPFTPGGGTDILTRSVGERMSAALGQQVVVENRAGGNTTVATELVVRAEPDGYSLLMQTNNLTANVTLYPTLPFDTFRDLAPVSLVASNPHILVVPASSPARNLQDFIALAKARPGELSFGTAGSGTVNHLAGEAFKIATGTDLLHVPYRGSGSLIPDLLAGRLASHFAALPVVSSHLRSGGLRALGLTTPQRHPAVPDVPTLVEQGLTDYGDFRSWFGLLAPARTPALIIARLSQEAAAAAKRTEVRARLADYEIHASSPQEFGAFLRRDAAVVGRLVRTLGITVE
jgi:tripartite-type tricarboxylate transporter receptor subunit TctC